MGDVAGLRRHAGPRATRLVPGASGADSELRFAVGLSLGAKILASQRLAFRFEARGFYTVVGTGGGS